MVDLSPGAVVKVVNPSPTVEVSMPGLVKSLWLKEGPTGAPGRSVNSIARTSGTGAPGTDDTYTITFSDGTSSTFSVHNGSNGTNGTNGRGISSVNRTSGTGAAGTTDTYTITYTDATTSTFTVANGTNGATGRGITSVARTSGTGAPGTTDTYTITYSDSTTSTFTVANGANGTGSGDVTGPASSVDSRVAVFDGTTGKTIKDSGVILGTAAAKNTGTGAGQIPVLSGTPGTASATTYLTGAGTWATPAGGGSGSTLLARKSHDPATGSTYSITAGAAPVAVDATNLTVTFTAPTSGAVVVILSGFTFVASGGSGWWSLQDGAGANIPGSERQATAVAARLLVTSRIPLTGLTSGASYTYRWAGRANAATLSIAIGGSSSEFAATTTHSGPAVMEVWSA